MNTEAFIELVRPHLRREGLKVYVDCRNSHPNIQLRPAEEYAEMYAQFEEQGIRDDYGEWLTEEELAEELEAYQRQ